MTSTGLIFEIRDQVQGRLFARVITASVAGAVGVSATIAADRPEKVEVLPRSPRRVLCSCLFFSLGTISKAAGVGVSSLEVQSESVGESAPTVGTLKRERSCGSGFQHPPLQTDIVRCIQFRV